MNTLSIAKTVLAVSCLAAGVAIVSSHSAEAGVITHVSGVICKPSSLFTRSYINYTSHSAENLDTTQSQTVLCGLPMHKSIGATLEYDFNIIDKSTTESVSCTVVALDTSNGVIYAPPAQASGTTFFGFKKMSVASGNFGSELQNVRHYASCILPRASGSNKSSVLGIRLF